MQTDTKIAKLYVDALLELKLEQHLLQDFYLQLKVCITILHTDAYVWKFFTSPIVTWQKKAGLVRFVFGPIMNKNLISFFIALVKRNRFRELFAIHSLLRKAINERLGERNVLVSSAQALEDEEERKLSMILKKYFNKKIALQKIIKKR